MYRPIAWSILLLLAGGCASSEPSAPSTGESITSTVTNSNGTVGPRPDLPLESIIGTQCEGLESNAMWPASLAPGETPPGWEDGPRDQTNVYDAVFSCKRVHAGPFERPLSIVMDAHDKNTPPPKCTEGYFGSVLILQAMWVNDTAVATWLRNTYQLPASVAVVDSTIANRLPGFESHEWRWTPQNYTAASSMSINTTKNGLHSWEHTFRYAWPNGEGISYMDWNDTFQITNPDNVVTTGDMQPPMLYASGRPNPYTGQGEVLFDARFDATVHAFRDFKCEQPR